MSMIDELRAAVRGAVDDSAKTRDAASRDASLFRVEPAVVVSPADEADVESLALDLVAWHKALKPAGETTVVFRDSAFADDVAKTNLTAILQQHGLETVRSL